MRAQKTHRRRQLTCLLFIAGSVIAGLPTGAASMSDLSRRIDELIEKEMAANHIVGLSIAAVSGDQVVYSKGFGYADLDRGVAATPETVYRMGSLSKVLTGTAVMQLQERGLVDIDVPIERYIPELRMKRRFVTSTTVTPRRLLTHHAGLPTDLMRGADTAHPESLDALIRHLNGEFTAQPSGVVFQYSNLGYAVLGAMIERVTGQRYSDYMNERIFAPLEMSSSGFFLSGAVHAKLSKGYLNGRESPQYPVRERPAAGLYASVSDMSRFIRMVLRRGRYGGHSVLRAETLREMLTRQNRNTPLDLDLACGLGWQLTHRLNNELNAGPMAWHDGWLWHFASALAVLPDHRLGVVVAANTGSAKGAVSRIAKAVLRRLLWQKAGVRRADHAAAAAEVPLAETVRRRLVGHYDTASGLIEIAFRDGYLEWRTATSRLRLIPLSDGTFAMERYLNDIVTFQPPDLEEKRLRFVEMADQLLIATLDNGVRIPLGRRVTPGAVPKSWRVRLGTYVNREDIDDFVFVKRVEVKLDQGLLTANIVTGGEFTRDMSLTVALTPDSSDHAFVMGVGRYRGDAMTWTGTDRRPRLRFQGYVLDRR